VERIRVVGIVAAAASWIDGAYLVSLLIIAVLVGYALWVQGRLHALERRVETIEAKALTPEERFARDVTP
jgi:hypothetical protein